MARLLLPAIAAVMLAGPAMAEDWRLVILDEVGATGVDATAITREGDVARATFLMVLASPDTFGPGSNLGHLTETTAYDCANRTATDEAVRFYAPDGALLEELPAEAPVEIGAGTPREFKWDAACNGVFTDTQSVPSQQAFIEVARAYYATQAAQ